MVHGDNSGLVLPPLVAPTQIMIIPIQQKKDGVLAKAAELKDMLSDFRVKLDDTDKTPGWKFSEQEMRGIPLRIEVGPKDIEAGKCVVVRRDSQTYTAKNYEEFKQIFAEKTGFVKAMWCGDRECEDKIKEDLAVTSRCMPNDQEKISDVCVCCGKPATKMVYWGKAY